MKPGFSFVEVIGPCPVAFGRRNRLGNSLEMVKLYNENSVIRNNVHPDETVIEEGKKLVLGKFVDIQRPTFLEMLSGMSNAGGTTWPDKGIVTESREG